MIGNRPTGLPRGFHLFDGFMYNQVNPQNLPVTPDVIQIKGGGFLQTMINGNLKYDRFGKISWSIIFRFKIFYVLPEIIQNLYNDKFS